MSIVKNGFTYALNKTHSYHGGSISIDAASNLTAPQQALNKKIEVSAQDKSTVKQFDLSYSIILYPLF